MCVWMNKPRDFTGPATLLRERRKYHRCAVFHSSDNNTGVDVAGKLVGPGHRFRSDSTRLFFPSFILYFPKLVCKSLPLGIFVFDLKGVRLCLACGGKKKRKEVIDIELTVKILCVQSKTV